jgi:hypothetical protein
LSTSGHAKILELFLNKPDILKPKLVVCYFAPPTLLRTQREIDQLGVLNRFREWLYGADAGLAAQEPLSQLPGYRLRRPLCLAANRLFATDELSGTKLDVQRGKLPSDDEIQTTLLETHGYLAEPRTGVLPSVESQPDNRAMLSPDSLRGIVQMFEMTDAMSIDLVFMMTPLPRLYCGTNAETAYQRLEEQLDVAARPFSRVTIRSPLLRCFNDEHFGTPQHLTRVGASRNSAEIAQMLQDITSKKDGSCLPPEEGR